MLLDEIKKTLSENLSDLLRRYPDVSRLDLSKRMNVADGTLGRIKYGTGNPQLENIWQIAEFFKIQPWQLLIPQGHKLSRDFDPFKVPAPRIEAGHVRIPVLEAGSSAGSGSEPVDWPVVLDHIDVAEAWAKKHLGNQADRIRAMPVNGDSMCPTINEGDLAFVDVSSNRFDTEGIYVIVWNDTLLIKRLSVDFTTNRVEIKSDNERHNTQHVSSEELDKFTICGRVKAWLAIKGY